jgi:hypothetical protein
MLTIDEDVDAAGDLNTRREVVSSGRPESSRLSRASRALVLSQLPVSGDNRSVRSHGEAQGYDCSA